MSKLNLSSKVLITGGLNGGIIVSHTGLVICFFFCVVEEAVVDDGEFSVAAATGVEELPFFTLPDIVFESNYA